MKPMHRTRYIYLLTITGLIAALGGCQYKSEDSLFGPAPTCDTAHATYSATIVPIIQNNGCLSCHSSIAPLAGFSLSTYEDVKTVAVNGKLYGALFHLSGFPPMPQGGAQLTPCELSKVQAWIDAGS